MARMIKARKCALFYPSDSNFYAYEYSLCPYCKRPRFIKPKTKKCPQCGCMMKIEFAILRHQSKNYLFVRHRCVHCGLKIREEENKYGIKDDKG